MAEKTVCNIRLTCDGCSAIIVAKTVSCVEDVHSDYTKAKVFRITRALVGYSEYDFSEETKQLHLCEACYDKLPKGIKAKVDKNTK